MNGNGDSRPGHATPGPALVEIAVGWTAALLVLVGRWSPTRLLGGEAHWLLEPRMWLSALLVAIGVLARPLDRRWRGSPAVLHVLTLQLTLFVYLLISLAWTPDVGAASPKARELISLVVALGAFGWVSLIRDPERVQAHFWAAIVALCGALALLSLAAMASGRLAVLGGGPNVLGRNLGLLALASLARAFSRPRSLPWLCMAAVAAFLVLLTGSRGALAALVVAGCLFGLTVQVEISRLLLRLAAGFGVGLLLLDNTALGRRAMSSFQERVVRLGFEEQYMSGREPMYEAAMELGLRHPLGGVGLGGYPEITGYVYPHNLFLEAFAEGGAIGLLLLVGAILVPLVSCLRRSPPAPALAVSAMVLMLVASQTSGDAYDTRSMHLFALMAASFVGRIGGPLAGPLGGPRVG